MSEYFLGELRLMSFNFAPKGWAQCNGQLLPINQNQALYSLLGTTYGGDGRTTFALPNLQGRVAIGTSSSYSPGTVAGQEQHTLIQSEIPPHSHVLMGNNSLQSTNQPGGNSVAEGQVTGTGGFNFNLYGTGTPDRTMNGGTLSMVGGQPHENRQPYLVLEYCISLQGLFPSRQ